jgi:hypothetical protein
VRARDGSRSRWEHCTSRAGRSGQRPRLPPPALPVRIGRYEHEHQASKQAQQLLYLRLCVRVLPPAGYTVVGALLRCGVYCRCILPLLAPKRAHKTMFSCSSQRRKYQVPSSRPAAQRNPFCANRRAPGGEKSQSTVLPKYCALSASYVHRPATTRVRTW